jgi:hypothetical protein
MIHVLRLLTALGIVTCLLWGLASCVDKNTEFSKIPSITFRQARFSPFSRNFQGSFPDTVYLEFDFKDGDGDLGLSELDTDGKYRQYFSNGATNPDYYNIMIDAFEVKPNSTQLDSVILRCNPNFGACSGFNGRIPDVRSKTGSPINGRMRYALIHTGFKPNGWKYQFRFYIKDRALNRSNRVTTDLVEIQGK